MNDLILTSQWFNSLGRIQVKHLILTGHHTNVAVIYVKMIVEMFWMIEAYKIRNQRREQSLKMHSC